MHVQTEDVGVSARHNLSITKPKLLLVFSRVFDNEMPFSHVRCFCYFGLSLAHGLKRDVAEP